MLIKCPECELQVSDKALSCPHCGFQLKQEELEKTNRKSQNKRRMRLPNGFGQITEIRNRNLRNLYRVMVPAGKTEEGRPISKLLKPQAYFRTYNEAYTALVEYHKNPNKLDQSITMAELYEKWIAIYETSAVPGRVRTIKAGWPYCHSIFDIPVSSIRIHHLRNCIENGNRIKNDEEVEVPPTMKQNIKTMLNMMLDYAVEYELTDRNYARLFSIGEKEETKKHHLSFTDDEMTALWTNISEPYIDLILIQCYMGWRPIELLELKVADVNLDKNIITGGKKTKAGTDRKVPIHPRIKPLIERHYKDAIEHNRAFLIEDPDTKEEISYCKYRRHFLSALSSMGLNPDHRPHDPRKHFVTMAKKYKVDEWAIKRIAGHVITDITEGVYTDRDDEWLYEEICKIE